MRRLYSILILFFSLSAPAQDIKHHVSLDLGSDSSDTRSSGLGYSYSPEDFTVYLDLQVSKNGPEATEASSRSFNFGVDSSTDALIPNASLSYGVALSSWGLKDELLHNSLSIPLGLDWTSWSVGFTPAVGRLRFENIGAASATRTTAANHFQFDVKYFGLEKWTFGVSSAKYGYGEDLTVFLNDRVAQFFTETTLGLTGSLLDSRSSLSVSYAFETADLGLRAGQSTSALDESVTGFSEVNGSIAINDRFEFQILLGSAKVKDYGLTAVANRDDERFNYASIGFEFGF